MTSKPINNYFHSAMDMTKNEPPLPKGNSDLKAIGYDVAITAIAAFFGDFKLAEAASVRAISHYALIPPPKLTCQ
jgi:hypothetical protein